MTRALEETYWGRFEGRYFAGDGAKLDDEGYLWLLGRVDDVMNVSGHRISTTEVESALVDHPEVAEAAVVGAKERLTGQAIVAFVTLRAGTSLERRLARSSPARVPNKIGPIGRPKTVILVQELPKTRSGKIMRRLLRDVAEGRAARRHHHARRPRRGRGRSGPGGRGHRVGGPRPRRTAARVGGGGPSGRAFPVTGPQRSGPHRHRQPGSPTRHS